MTVLLAVISASVWLNRAGVIVPYWGHYQLGGIEPETGYAYIAQTDRPELSSDVHPSLAQVWENGKPLSGPLNALHDDIRQKGEGQYSFWGNYVYFSTSDNSNPLINNRRYTIVYPWMVKKTYANILYMASLLLGLITWFTIKNQNTPETNKLKKAVENIVISHPNILFYLSVSILFIIFLVTRLPFFLSYPVVEIPPDTASYLVPFKDNHGIPYFIMRTPGYPLFVHAISLLSNQWLVVVIVQNLLSIISCTSLLLGIFYMRRQLVLPAALAMSGFLGSSQVLIYDTATISESLYTNTIIMSFVCMLMAFGRRNPIYFWFTSVALAAAILVRPAGIYFLVIYILVLIYLFLNGYPNSNIIGFAIPLPIILLSLCCYNYLVIGVFSLSPWGEANLGHATILYWEPDNLFDENVNAVLEELPNALEKTIGFTEQDRKFLANSWDLKQLKTMFERGFTGQLYVYTLGKKFSNANVANNSYDTQLNYVDTRSIIKKISLLAIRKHPDLYLKFILSNELGYFNNITTIPEFYSALAYRADLLYDQKIYSSTGMNASSAYVAKEYADSRPPNTIKLVGTGSDHSIVITDTILKRLHISWESVQNNVFQKKIWVWAYFGVLCMSAIQLLRFRGHHLGAFILFVLTITPLGASLVICLVEISSERYAYPTQFIYYLSVALSPLLWIHMDNFINNRKVEND